MTVVLHITDTHFGTEVPAVVQALLALAAGQKPDLVLLSGDITQRARRDQFAAARRFIEALQLPVLAVPGNHDIPLYNVVARLLNPYGNYRSALGAVLEPSYEDERLLVLGVNSTRPRRHKDGEVSPAQVQRVAQRLRAGQPQQLKLVMLHHPVRAIEPTDVANLLIGRELAVPQWVDAGVDLILGGHIHLPYVVPVLGSAGEAGRRAWAVQAGTAVSHRVRGSVPNSVNLIRHEFLDGVLRCELERWDFHAEQGAFACIHATPLG
ncbi:DNA repair exonuclease [Bordetella ansorpii]|uniref:DNA repair exonuclease n=1 Tax=Bordetella ansorpii TaxID=288768 RepID=A0A157PN96_9BORD|nr:metallophosphoesterase [Bordetella ansorpii]SAI34858.1 DNA repair exonuclease [Bordetella ansorpii]